jgi:hypothetical protein
VGISPEAVALAAQSLELRRQAVTRSFLGLPIGVERTVALNRWLTRRGMGPAGGGATRGLPRQRDGEVYGSLRQWTNGNLQALLEPTANGHRLRLGTVKGDARTAMASGWPLSELREPSLFPARSAATFTLRYQGSRYWPSPDSGFSPLGRSECRAGPECGAARWKALPHDWLFSGTDTSPAEPEELEG